jgi:MFS family permease
MAAIAMQRFFYGLSTIDGVLLFRNYFANSHNTGAGLRGLAFAFAAGAIGVVIAALITPRVVRRTGEERWAYGLFGAAAVIELALGLGFNKWALIAAALLLGIVAQGSKICVDSLVQRSIDDVFRGRVFAFYDIVFNVSFVAAAAYGAATLPMNGKSYAVIVTIACGYALTGIGYARASRLRERSASLPIS